MGGYSESEWPLLFCTNACTARADPLSVGTSHAGLLDIGEASPSPRTNNPDKPDSYNNNPRHHCH